MIGSYYRARGLEPTGPPRHGTLTELDLGAHRPGLDTSVQARETETMATTSSSATGRRSQTVSLRIDGHDVTVSEGTTILDAAAELGIAIPVLCHDDRYDPVGVCRMCVVDVGARVYAAACVRACEDGMEVTTAGDRARSPPRHPDRAAALRPARPGRGPQGDDHRRQRAAGLVRQYGVRKDDRPDPARNGPRDRRLEPSDRRRPRCLHPLRPVRPGLRRHPGQRCHRPQRQGLLHPDRV